MQTTASLETMTAFLKDFDQGLPTIPQEFDTEPCPDVLKSKTDLGIVPTPTEDAQVGGRMTVPRMLVLAACGTGTEEIGCSTLNIQTHLGYMGTPMVVSKIGPAVAALVSAQLLQVVPRGHAWTAKGKEIIETIFMASEGAEQVKGLSFRTWAKSKHPWLDIVENLYAKGFRSRDEMVELTGVSQTTIRDALKTCDLEVPHHREVPKPNVRIEETPAETAPVQISDSAAPPIEAEAKPNYILPTFSAQAIGQAMATIGHALNMIGDALIELGNSVKQ